MTISPGVVTAIHLAGVRGEPCGTERWTAVQRTAPQGHNFKILVLNFETILNYSVTLRSYRTTP